MCQKETVECGLGSVQVQYKRQLGTGADLRAVLAGAVGVAPGQETHEHVHQRGVRDHLLSRALLSSHRVTGASWERANAHTSTVRHTLLTPLHSLTDACSGTRLHR